jgi:glutathione peroxidase
MRKGLWSGVAALGVFSAAAVGQPPAKPGSDGVAPAKPAGQPVKPVKVTPEKPAEKAPPQTGQSEDPYVLGFTMKRIDGKEESLEKYKGKVVVLVNVASQCGFTSQYEGLEKLYASKKDQGLVILGFPANNFGSQEPGTNEEVAKFCKDKFGVTFPMFEKISVKGPDQHPLYKKLAGQPTPIGGDPKWNFTKFVVDQTGHVVARFDAEKANVRTANLESGLLAKVDELLARKDSEGNKK